ncbi:MAG: hypothetical protein C7B45_02975 [Sulfobacillus acidophilus]|uniref:UspA domain-containing protein n=1 Tax=Sulfobacillus acidophilus TaxID=53633 RepID=A0A2T2WMQ6_9FIRM|nr:MAG: hypothetical protein C7B45_02975 [Sulfobacillus acidophilus]
MTLLLASDGSEGALKAARWIMEHFGPEHWQVTVASVSRTPTVMGSPTFATLPSYADTIEDAAVQEARQACEQTMTVLEGWHVDCTVLTGPSIADALIGYVRSHPVDAIVVGRRSHSLSRHLLGSISSELASHSPIPVWVIP